MLYETHTLSNGLRVLLVPASSAVVYCGYAIRVGSRDERPGEEGMAHLCEHAAFKGTARRSPSRVALAIESVGGDLNAFTNKEETVFHAALLREHLPRAVDVLTDMVFHGAYPHAEIEKEIEVIKDEIESYNDSPSELIYDEFDALILGDHPLGHNILGDSESLGRYSADDARRFANRHYRPDNAVFFVRGDVKMASLARMLERATADMPTRQPSLEPRPLVLPRRYAPVDLTRQRNTHQAHVMMGNRGYAAGSERRVALYMLSNLLGGPGMSSRLNVALREKNGLVYSVESSTACYSDAGVWSVYFGCDPGDAAKCRQLVRRELEKLTRKPLSATRLAALKRQVKGQIGVARDNGENLVIDLARSYLRLGHAPDAASTLDKIDHVTAEDMLLTAREVFAGDMITTLTFV